MLFYAVLTIMLIKPCLNVMMHVTESVSTLLISDVMVNGHHMVGSCEVCISS